LNRKLLHLVLMH